jgi:hypothetical protein
VTAVLTRIDHARVREHAVDANDGIIASAGIVEGLAGAGASSTILLVASLAAMVGGGFALAGMRYAEAADERDAQHAILEAERRRIALTPTEEEAELADLYRARGFSAQLARAVAAELSAGDALAAHAEAEYGIVLREQPATPRTTAVLAGLAFAIGAGVPLAVVPPPTIVRREVSSAERSTLRTFSGECATSPTKRCSSEAADTRRPGWSNTLEAALSPPGAM